jgi:hypothetical protein
MSGKHYLGETGFPTPSGIPDSVACRTFSLPDSAEWFSLLMGALLPLQDPNNYYNWGDLSPDDTAAVFRQAILDAYAAAYTSTCIAPIDTPFWDDSSADDADDESPADSQSWYGVWDGETFVEAISYWAISAFLATGITEGAAIQFITPLRTFRLTLKGNPNGAKLLAFMDGNLFQTIDLFRASDEAINVDIVSPGSTLMLVHSGDHNPDSSPDSNGNYLVQVIKSQLRAEDVIPPNIRYDGSPPVFQVTNDGGATWVDSPAADPRHNPQGLLPPLTPYSGVECDVAARMTAQLKAELDNFISAGDAAQWATEIIGLLVFPFGWAGWFLDLLLAGFNILIDIGQADINAAFTSTVYDDIQCIFSCYIGPDGQITQDSLDAAYNQIESEHAGVVATTIEELRFFNGDVAMSNAGVSRTETGDCSGCPSCDWVVEFDFTQGNVEGWQAYVDSSYGYGSYNGAMFVGVHTGAPVELFMWWLSAGLHITGISAYAEQFHGTGLGHTLYVMNLTSNTPTWSVHASGGIPTNTPPSWIVLNTDVWTTTSGLGLYYICDSNGTGYVRVQKIRISGTGTPPPGKRVNSLT